MYYRLSWSIEEDPHNTPLKNCWYARPQLFFKCALRPKDGRKPKNPSYRFGPDDLSYYLVFFNTFGELTLPITGPMEDAGAISDVLCCTWEVYTSMYRPKIMPPD